MSSTRTEIDFPRGKSVNDSQTGFKNKSGRRKQADDDLFKVHKRRFNDDEDGNKKETKRKKRKKIKSDDEEREKIIIECMTISRLPEGVNILGCIQEINDYELKMCLPGGIMAKIPITNISNSYTRLLEKFAENPNSMKGEEVLKPNGMFLVGQCFPVRIISKSDSESFGMIEVIGSLNPQHIYSDMVSSSLMSVPKMCLVAAVDSIEDHGYMMDVGLKDVHAFLSKEKAQAAIQMIKGRKSLSVGQLIVCAIDSVTERSISLTTKLKTVTNFKITENANIALSSLMPGMTVPAIIMNTSLRGLELKVLSEFSGFVTRNHLKQTWDHPKKNYTIGQRVEGTILYIHPITKHVALSLKPKLEPLQVRNTFNGLKVGTIINDAEVVGRDEMNCVVFKLNNDMMALASKKQLFEKNMNDPEEADIDTKYTVGSKHRCRIRSINFMDSLVKITLRQSLLDSKVISIEDLSVGSIIKGTVKKVTMRGVIFQLGFGVKGFAPYLHLTETPISSHHEKLFPLGKEVKCRVTKLDRDSNPPKVSLTCKKSLLNKNLNILTNYEDAKPNFQTDGVVVFMNQKGLLIEFFNGIKGWVPNKFMSTYRVDFPEKIFQKGQVVKCSVVSTRIEEEKMTCSLINIKNKSTNKNKNILVGQILKKMKIKNKTEKGFDLVNDAEDVTCFLPFGHLSDDVEMSSQLSKVLNINDIINEVVVFSKTVNLIIVSKKFTFIEASKNGNFISQYDKLVPEIVVPAVINGFATFGIFIELPGRIKGLVPKRFLTDGHFDEPKDIGYSLMQTVFAQLKEIEETETTDTNDKNTNNTSKRKKLTFSLKLSHVWKSGFEDRIDLIKYYLIDSAFHKSLIIKNSSGSDKKLVDFEIGKVINYRVIQLNESEILCNISCDTKGWDNSITGIIKRENVDAERDVKVGSCGTAVVLNVNFNSNTVELSICQKLIKQIKSSLKNNLKSLVKVDQVFKCTPIHISKEYILVVLSGHSPGTLAYLPSKRHWNDLCGIGSLFSLNESYRIIIKHTDNNLILAVLKPENSNNKLSSKINSLPSFRLNREMTENKIRKKDSDENETKSRKKLKRQKNEEKTNDNEDPSKSDSNKDSSQNLKSDESSRNKKKKTLDVGGFSWDDDSVPEVTHLVSQDQTDPCSESDNDNNDVSQEKNTKRKKSRSERNEEVRQKEEQLRKTEKLLMDTGRKPETVDDYEKACLASPNSSLVWISFMVFYLEQNEVEKARSIAERALKMISFREEQEKLNVWVASLNLENMYGTQSSLDEVFQKAIQQNEAIVVYNQLANIYSKSNKLEEAEALYYNMTKKFKQDKNVWINFGLFFMRNNRTESARKLMQRCLTTLDKRDHIDVILKFAQMEFKFGDAERGKTLFENLLASFPKRLDLWSVYIDMLIKHHNDKSQSLDAIRNIFEKVITLKLPARKMKFIFKRFIEFESQFGNEDRIERIKQKALEYVETKNVSI